MLRRDPYDGVENVTLEHFISIAYTFLVQNDSCVIDLGIISAWCRKRSQHECVLVLSRCIKIAKTRNSISVSSREGRCPKCSKNCGEEIEVKDCRLSKQSTRNPHLWHNQGLATTMSGYLCDELKPGTLPDSYATRARSNSRSAGRKDGERPKVQA